MRIPQTFKRFQPSRVQLIGGAIILTSGLIAYAAVPNTFTSGTPIIASQVNANFADADTRITTLETEITALKALVTQDVSTTAAPVFAGLRTTGPVHVAFIRTSISITLDESNDVVVADGEVTVTLPKCAPGNRGRVYTIRAGGTSSFLNPAAGDSIVGGATVTVSNPKSVVSDGVNTWFVI